MRVEFEKFRRSLPSLKRELEDKRKELKEAEEELEEMERMYPDLVEAQGKVEDIHGECFELECIIKEKE